MKKILITLSVVALIFIGTYLLDYIKEKSFIEEFNLKLKKREDVIEKIKSKTLSLDENNNVILSDDYSDIAVNNYIHIFVFNEKEKLLSFLYKPGFPDEDQYIFYTSNGIQLIQKYVAESMYCEIKKIKDNWYFVQYN